MVIILLTFTILRMNLTVNEKLDASSLEAFLRDFFAKRQPATYLDGKIDTFPAKRRSFSDILSLCKSYFDCTEEQVAEIIISFWKDYIIGCLFCPNINKVVFYLRDTERESNHLITPNYFKANPLGGEGYNRPTTVGEDGYSFTDIYNLVNNK